MLVDDLVECSVSVPAKASAYPWFAIRVRANFERITALSLRQQGYEEFLPTYTVRRQWSDRVCELEQPLFPGYVFCRFDPHNRLPILCTPGVVHIVGFGKEPQPVDEREMHALRTLMTSGLLAKPCPFLNVGDSIRIVRGPLADAEGILVSIRNKYRVVISIHILQRSVMVDIEGSWIQAAPRRTRSSVATPARLG